MKLPTASPSSDRHFWLGKRVFVTGHMGFKGTWLLKLLEKLGATTIGFGEDARLPLLYRNVSLSSHVHIDGNIRDLEHLRDAVFRNSPDFLFHLAAQPIVLTSYRDPVSTFHDNVIGTVNVLEAARVATSLKCVIIVTSDKVYKNTDSIWGYREGDALGGSDPYSASKAAAEIATAAMAQSFFGHSESSRIATVRAGNVIGGGDWADFRLLPDAARALSQSMPLSVRNPDSTRPWQHVLDPLAGYLLAAEKLSESPSTALSSWNFGPAIEDALPVRDIAELFVKEWGGNAGWIQAQSDTLSAKEAKVLAVDSTLARSTLGWAPRWRVEEAVLRTAAWYRDYFGSMSPDALVARDIEAFLN